MMMQNDATIGGDHVTTNRIEISPAVAEYWANEHSEWDIARLQNSVNFAISHQITFGIYSWPLVDHVKYKKCRQNNLDHVDPGAGHYGGFYCNSSLHTRFNCKPII